MTSLNHTKNAQLDSLLTSVLVSPSDILFEKKIQDALIWIDLDDKISQPMINEIKDKDGLPRV